MRFSDFNRYGFLINFMTVVIRLIGKVFPFKILFTGKLLNMFFSVDLTVN